MEDDGLVFPPNPYLKKQEKDVLYHLGLATDKDDLPALFGDVKVWVCLTVYSMKSLNASKSRTYIDYEMVNKNNQYSARAVSMVMEKEPPWYGVVVSLSCLQPIGPWVESRRGTMWIGFSVLTVCWQNACLNTRRHSEFSGNGLVGSFSVEKQPQINMKYELVKKLVDQLNDKLANWSSWLVTEKVQANPGRGVGINPEMLLVKPITVTRLGNKIN